LAGFREHGNESLTSIRSGYFSICCITQSCSRMTLYHGFDLHSGDAKPVHCASMTSRRGASPSWQQRARFRSHSLGAAILIVLKATDGRGNSQHNCKVQSRWTHGRHNKAWIWESLVDFLWCSRSLFARLRTKVKDMHDRYHVSLVCPLIWLIHSSGIITDHRQTDSCTTHPWESKIIHCYS